MIGAAIYGILSGASAITSLVSTRIYPMVAPQNSTMPYITYSTITNTPSDTKSGVSKVDSILVQFDIYDTTVLSVEGVYEALRATLDFIAPATYNSIQIDGVSFRNERQLYEEDFEVHRKSVDFQFRIKYT